MCFCGNTLFRMESLCENSSDRHYRAIEITHQDSLDISSDEDWSYAESDASGVLESEHLADDSSIVSIPCYLYESGEMASLPQPGEDGITGEELNMMMEQSLDLLDDEDDEDKANMKILHAMLQQWFLETCICEVCLEDKPMFIRPCCKEPVCDDCMLQYLTAKVENAKVMIECPMFYCQQLVSRDEINARLPLDIRTKFQRFLIDLNKEPNKKTCPRCSDVMTLDMAIVKQPRFRKSAYIVHCATCTLQWCFPCHSPWHQGISCKQFRKGDRLLRSWAKQQENGQVNARRCPSCKVFIERTAGCSHMKCTECKTSFCYNCGGRYMGSGYLGRHMDKYSVFGCKYRFKPDQPAQRRLIRGTIFTGKILATPLIATLAVGGGALLVATSVFYLPVLVARKLYREHKRRKRMIIRQQYLEERKRYLDHIHKAGDPYLEQFQRLRQLGYSFRLSSLAPADAGHFRPDPLQESSEDQESVSSSVGSGEEAGRTSHTVSVHVEAASDLETYAGRLETASENCIASETEVEINVPPDDTDDTPSTHDEPVYCMVCRL